MQGRLHPSLRTFVDSFMSHPLPKMFPHGGGVYDQDPILMRDFREILKLKGQSEAAQERMREQDERTSGPTIGGESGLESLLDRYAEDHDL